MRTAITALFAFALSCAAPQARADPAAPGPPPTSWSSTTLVFAQLPAAAP